MRLIVLSLAALLFVADRASAQAENYDGRPSFAEGVELGYYLWRDGDTWHLRWTTVGTMRNFTGFVEATGGELKSLKRIDVESESRVLYPGRTRRVVVGPRDRARVRGGRPPVVVSREQDRIEKDGDRRIVFAARTDDDIDGFDFKVDKNVESLRLRLEVGGNPVPNLVEAGKNNLKPGVMPLVIRLK
jgi:hypothetical protein